ncbi:MULTISPECIES: amino acid adenylation domain-containing protein [unclassified Streptomyces]|uniref:amino acid adenylation domain-containing protein n=1 Tax=unclassified Streptomyces TaxID=2593676 RepID=UPI003407CE63
MSALERLNGTRLTGTEEAFALHRRINRTATDYPRDSSVPALFAASAARRPDALAVVQDERAYTYARLDRLSNGLARRMLAQGFTPGSTAGVCLTRSPELIVALLAVLKCGGVYLPFDAGWPDERLRGPLARADCRWVLTDRPGQLARRLGACHVLPVDEGLEECGTAPGVEVGGDALAYVNFTSGSTGSPKGVAIRHRSIARLVLGARFARLEADSRLLQLAPVTFDAATFEIWGALLNGGTCVLYPEGLVRLSRLGRVIDDHRVTVVFLTTALFNAVIDEAPGALDGTETVLMGGELHSIPHVAAALRRYGPGRLVHVYGPTEATTFATYHPIDRLIPDSGLLPIGTPIQNTRLYVTDGTTLCEPGRTGEICLAGDGLSPGYLGMPELTAERFVDREIDGVRERLYRTGDHGTLLPDGSLVFQGREDDQVKINGFRIELGEVAHHLDRHPAVRRSHVAVSTERGERSLVAFVVADGAVTSASLRHHLRTLLPAYLVPARIHLCEALPLTATGKVDGRALLAAHDPHTPPPAAPAAQPVATRD